MLQNLSETPSKFKQQRQPCCIKYLIPSKVAYFLFYGFVGITFPYLNAFFVDIGLSIEQTGYINGFRTLFPLGTSPLIGLLADYTKNES